MLSPAHLGGERAKLLFNERATFPLARSVRSAEGAALGDVFSFVSGLYFRGKVAYTEAFGRPPPGLAKGLVISPCEGLVPTDARVGLDRLRSWAGVEVDAGNRVFTDPLVEHAEELVRVVGQGCRFVLLGSVATDKYLRPLEKVFGDWLMFPSDFAGKGDMSRGSMMLKAARAGVELAYVPTEGARKSRARAARG